MLSFYLVYFLGRLIFKDFRFANFIKKKLCKTVVVIIFICLLKKNYREGQKFLRADL